MSAADIHRDCFLWRVFFTECQEHVSQITSVKIRCRVKGGKSCGNKLQHLGNVALRERKTWVSYQIRKIADCACTGNAGNVFSATDSKGNRQLAIPAHITAHASRTWCMSGSLTPGGGENVSGISGVCTTHKYTYLASGPYVAKNKTQLNNRANFWKWSFIYGQTVVPHSNGQTKLGFHYRSYVNINQWDVIDFCTNRG